MSQADYNIGNASGATVRADFNAQLQAIATLNSGATEPAVMFAYMLWADTTAGVLRIRNAANTAWIGLGVLDTPGLRLRSRGYKFGMTLANNLADGVYDLEIGAGEAAPETESATERILLTLNSTMIKQADATWAAGTNAGGRVAGQALGNGTWHVYAFRRSGGQTDVCFSNALSFTLPDSGTHRRRIGSLLRESNLWISFTQWGRRFRRLTEPADLDEVNPGITPVARYLSIPDHINLLAMLRIWITQESTSINNIWRVYDAGASVSGLIGNIETIASGPSLQVGVAAGVVHAVNRQIVSVVGTSNASTRVGIDTLGWIDYLLEEGT